MKLLETFLSVQVASCAFKASGKQNDLENLIQTSSNGEDLHLMYASFDHQQSNGEIPLAGVIRG